jgi:hypothetical protein
MTTPDLAAVKQAVKESLDEILLGWGAERVRVVPDGQGGAWIEIFGAELGDPYIQDDTFVICLLPFNLPAADIYPLFVRRDLSRRDGQALGPGFALTEVAWPGDPQPRPIVQVSRRTRGGFTLQTPRQKIDKVLEWVRCQ